MSNVHNNCSLVKNVKVNAPNIIIIVMAHFRRYPRVFPTIEYNAAHLFSNVEFRLQITIIMSIVYSDNISRDKL